MKKILWVAVLALIYPSYVSAGQPDYRAKYQKERAEQEKEKGQQSIHVNHVNAQPKSSAHIFWDALWTVQKSRARFYGALPFASTSWMFKNKSPAKAVSPEPESPVKKGE